MLAGFVEREDDAVEFPLPGWPEFRQQAGPVGAQRGLDGSQASRPGDNQACEPKRHPHDQGEKNAKAPLQRCQAGNGSHPGHRPRSQVRKRAGDGTGGEQDCLGSGRSALQDRLLLLPRGAIDGGNAHQLGRGHIRLRATALVSRIGVGDGPTAGLPKAPLDPLLCAQCGSDNASQTDTCFFVERAAIPAGDIELIAVPDHAAGLGHDGLCPLRLRLGGLLVELQQEQCDRDAGDKRHRPKHQEA